MHPLVPGAARPIGSTGSPTAMVDVAARLSEETATCTSEVPTRESSDQSRSRMVMRGFDFVFKVSIGSDAGGWS